MTQEQARDNRPNSETDEAFWEALFRTEDSYVADFRDPAIQPNGAELEPELIPVPQETSRPEELPLSSETDPWKYARECFESDKILHLKVTGHNKGGLLVVLNTIQGFVPASQLINFPQFHIHRERLRALAEWQGRELNLKIIEVNQEKSRLVFSERATLVAAEDKEILLNKVNQGDVCTGTVTNLTEFGAFVDLGGVEGLIHISEISWSRVSHPSMVLQPGQQVQVLVLNVNPNSERVALSVKRLRSDPWDSAEDRYKPGQLVHGVVGNITTYGAFVILEEELEGLVHISELAEGMFLHPRDVVQSGEAVVARVLNVDSRQKRIALTMRTLGNNPVPGQ